MSNAFSQQPPFPGARFRNRMAVFVWVFTAIWLAMLVAMTWLVYRDGPPDGYSPAATFLVLLFFWVGGAGLFAFAVSRPCFFVAVAASGNVQVTWLYPFRIVRLDTGPEQLHPARLVEEEDSEGDPYYVARIDLAGGREFRLAEGHHRPTVEHACAAFNEAVAARSAR